MTRPVDPFYKEVGRRIQGARLRRGLTQEQVGQRLTPPVKRASLANVERGKQRLLLHTVVQLTQILACDLQDLVPAKDRARIDIKNKVSSELTKLKLPNRAVERISRQLVANWPGATK